METKQGTEYKNVTLANKEQKAEFLCGILYHKFKTTKEDFNKKFNITVSEKSLYEQLKNAKITEYLGVYYQDDTNQEDAEEGDGDNKPEANKTEKRIITYKVQY